MARETPRRKFERRIKTALYAAVGELAAQRGDDATTISANVSALADKVAQNLYDEYRIIEKPKPQKVVP